MKMKKIKSWQHKVTGVDGNVELFGVNIFDLKWENTNEKARVYDPLYGKNYRFNIYKVILDSKEYMFAAGEFSNCIWGFYTYEY